jgi:hypothetical protein
MMQDVEGRKPLLGVEACCFDSKHVRPAELCVCACRPAVRGSFAQRQALVVTACNGPMCRRGAPLLAADEATLAECEVYPGDEIKVVRGQPGCTCVCVCVSVCVRVSMCIGSGSGCH